MAHELEVAADGRASMAYTGETPWHGLGQVLTPGADLITWQQEAGLDWAAKLGAVHYNRMILDVDGVEKPLLTKYPERCVIYRSDTGTPLSVVSNGYRPVQPSEVIEFYRDLTERFGFELETAGALKGGRRIWALANTKNAFQLRGGDVNCLYLLLATSFDGTMATQARLTAVRVVCNNTIEIATQGRQNAIFVPHSTKFDADAVKLQLNIGEAWEQYQQNAQSMSERIVSQDETVRFFMNVYLGLTNDDEIAKHAAEEGNTAKVEKLTKRLTEIMFNSPGSHLASAKGTLWGILNTVTRDQDFARPARSQENRLNASWFGDGATIKARALDLAAKMVA